MSRLAAGSAGLSVVLVCLLGFVNARSFLSLKSILKDNTLEPTPVEELVESMGYPFEAHNITTEDGYILTYHRIPHGKEITATAGPPVIVQHGLEAASPVWVTANNSLAFVLADAGFDVWLGNCRGNEFSRQHIKYDPDKDKSKFFDYSWHEMGYYDLPASIDYILNVTGNTQLSYIGHSMGTTMYFVLGATRPEYMDKINAGLMLAPVAYLKNMKTPVFNIMHDFQDLINVGRLTFHMYELLKYRELWYVLNHMICGNEKTEFICRDALFLVMGFDQPELSRDKLAQYLEYLPGGSSFRTLLHYGQIIDGDFKQYDYGFIRNLIKYRSLTPPSYDLGNVNAPTYFYVGPNDWIAVPDTVVESAQKMPNLQGLIMVQDPLFSHGDFMWGLDAKELVYEDMLTVLDKHNSNTTSKAH